MSASVAVFRCGICRRVNVKSFRVTKSKSDASLCSPHLPMTPDCCPGRSTVPSRWNWLPALWEAVSNKLWSDPPVLLRCGTRKADRSCRTSTLTGEPSCPVMSHQTEDCLLPPLLTGPLRFHTWDETHLFVPEVPAWPFTHQCFVPKW